MRVMMRNFGEETLISAGANLEDHLYRIRGGLERALWFNDNATFVWIQFAAKDGSNIVCQLR